MGVEVGKMEGGGRIEGMDEGCGGMDVEVGLNDGAMFLKVGRWT